MWLFELSNQISALHGYVQSPESQMLDLYPTRKHRFGCELGKITAGFNARYARHSSIALQLVPIPAIAPYDRQSLAR
jgi:hypothetical protein